MAGQGSNERGKTAENTVDITLTKLSNETFRVIRLGDKWPLTDMYVEIEYKGATYFFLIQVKSSTRGFTTKGDLKVNVPKTKINGLAKHKVPTYLLGYDWKANEIVAKMFIQTIRGTYSSGISTMRTSAKYELNAPNIKKLRKEVIEFWLNAPDLRKRKYKTNF